MRKQFPWVRNFWEGLSDEGKKDVASKAAAIRKFSATDAGRSRALEQLRQLCDAYEVIENDCGFVLNEAGIHDPNTVPCSSLEFLVNYFEQFPEMMVEEKVKEAIPQGEKQYRLHNDYWGDIIGIIVRETPSSYYFKCYRGDDVVMDSWRLAKDSARIIGEVE